MLYIHKITSHPTVDFAAEELKKYLRMMMPEENAEIRYAPDATDGFRLGLMQDFGLDLSDVRDTALDDVLFVDTDTAGGIIAGSNPRSVLMAVYEFFRQNGCRWLFPGVDGEYIPMQRIQPVRYRHAASCRYRGPCIEGATSQRVLLDTIEFLPKQGMNLFMSQFFVPTAFYNRYYNRDFNKVVPPEGITGTQMLQWKVQYESELAKRGLQFHDVGHGWTAQPFGVDVSSAWTPVDDSNLPEESRQYLAMIDGERRLFRNRAINTQFCMSNAKARQMVATSIADYAAVHSNVDFLHVWLADASRNHCECEKCAEKTVSDWYVMLLNDIDRCLSDRGISTKIVFIVYTDTTWAPVEERLHNPARFTLMLAPISRSYTSSLTDGKTVEPVPFERNKTVLPKDLDLYMAYFDLWKQKWTGDNVCFEYHFWRHQLNDLSGQVLAKRIFEDIEGYKSRGVDGMIACGSQRSFFPNGFAYYVFARKQYDVSLSYEELLEDYYSHAYGEDWREFADYLLRLGNTLGFGYMEGEESEDKTISPFYSPKKAIELEEIPHIVEEGRRLIESHYNSHDRVKTVSVRLLEVQAGYAPLLANAMKLKALEKTEEALDYVAEEISPYLGRLEAAFETYFDFDLILRQLRILLKKKYNPPVQF